MAIGNAKLRSKFEVTIFSRCINIKGEPQILKSFLAQGHAHFSSAWNFMMCLGKAQRLAKFEVASFSRCKNIKGELKNFGELP